jgi:hypothetical protein
MSDTRLCEEALTQNEIEAVAAGYFGPGNPPWNGDGPPPWRSNPVPRPPVARPVPPGYAIP